MHLYENHVKSHWFYRHEPPFLCPLTVTYWPGKNSSLHFKVLALNSASSCRTISHADIEYQRTNDFQVLPLCVKNSTSCRAFCQTGTQQLGLSTKWAPHCCWGERWQVPLRCGCLKIKRSSVVCRGLSVSVIASSRQLWKDPIKSCRREWRSWQSFHVAARRQKIDLWRWSEALCYFLCACVCVRIANPASQWRFSFLYCTKNQCVYLLFQFSLTFKVHHSIAVKDSNQFLWPPEQHT